VHACTCVCVPMRVYVFMHVCMCECVGYACAFVRKSTRMRICMRARTSACASKCLCAHQGCVAPAAESALAGLLWAAPPARPQRSLARGVRWHACAQARCAATAGSACACISAVQCQWRSAQSTVQVEAEGECSAGGSEQGVEQEVETNKVRCR